MTAMSAQKNQSFEPFARKMRAAGQTEPAIAAARQKFAALLAGDTGQIPECSLEPVERLPRMEEVYGAGPSAPELLARTVVLKLNGGLGTSMGLSGPKSLLPVREGLTFLDLIVKQVLHLRQQHGDGLRFLLMNSFSTSSATLNALGCYSQLGEVQALEVLQSQAPKVDVATQLPAECPGKPELEWYPPGHGDLYAALQTGGRLARLLSEGVKYLFVSNSDNLGASLDTGLLRYFAASGQSFLMEVCERTPADKKGGHLARRGGKLILRESAQCPGADKVAFENIQRHRFFNTNNLWVRLDRLSSLLAEHGGLLPLPLIKNTKTLNPSDKQSPPVIQLESAMGAAIELFTEAGAVVVPPARFAPVKTCEDLFAIRSDAYVVTPDWRIELHPARQGRRPKVQLDPKFYWHVDFLEAALKQGVPSLRDCEDLKVEGPVSFCGRNVFRGRVTVRHSGTAVLGEAALPPGKYADETVLV